MQYFFMRFSTDPKVIGTFPQLEKMYTGFHGHYRYEAWGLFSERRQIPMERITGFKLYHHAKVTDWVSAAQFGTDSGLFSERLFQLLNAFDCMEMIAIDSEVNHRDRAYAYRFVYLPQTYNHFVDFHRSSFYLNGSNGRIMDIKFNNYQEYEKAFQELEKANEVVADSQAFEKMRSIRAHQIYLDENAINKDFFRLTKISIEWIVSERLKNAMESAEMQGMVFIPIQVT